MFKSRKAYIHHPVGAIIVGFLLGLLLMYLMARGTIPAPFRIKERSGQRAESNTSSDPVSKMWLRDGVVFDSVFEGQ